MKAGCILNWCRSTARILPLRQASSQINNEQTLEDRDLMQKFLPPRHAATLKDSPPVPCFINFFYLPFFCSITPVSRCEIKQKREAAGACHMGFVVLNEQWLIALPFGGNAVNLRGTSSMPSFSLQMSLGCCSSSLLSRSQCLSASLPRLRRGEMKWEGTCCELWLSEVLLLLLLWKDVPHPLCKVCNATDSRVLRLLGQRCFAQYR